MKQLTRNELAAIKRLYKNNSTIYAKIKRLENKKDEIDLKIEELYAQAELMENPARAITGGLTSKEYLELLETSTEEVEQEEGADNDIDTYRVQEEVEEEVEKEELTGSPSTPNSFYNETL